MLRVRLANGFAAIVVSLACAGVGACATGGEDASGDGTGVDASHPGTGLDGGNGDGSQDDGGGDGAPNGADGGSGDSGHHDSGGGDAASSLGPPSRSLTSGATVSTSTNFKAIRTLGQTPGGNGNASSPHYQFHGGLVGATQ